MTINNLQELFLHTLRDVYYAENQILKALPKMAGKTDNTALRQAFETHERETEGHVKRLDQVFDTLGEKSKGVKCHAMEGIIKEAEEIMSDTNDADTRDAGMIAAAQAVEHYEITRYGTLVAWSEQLGYNEVTRLLRETLDEEKSTDAKLTQLAEQWVNRQATA